MIFDEKAETAAPGELKRIQSERLARLVEYVRERNPIYRRMFEEAGVHPSDIRGIDDIGKLPVLTKDHMRDTYPYGLFCVDREEIAELHVSSGTTGNPVLVGYTKNDLSLWGRVMARSFALAGAVPGDVLQVAYGYGLFTGGLGAHYGGLELGMTVIPASSGNTKRQLKLMTDFRPRILACTPSYALYMAEEAKAMGLDPASSSWEIGVFGAEPWSEAMRESLESTWGLRATDIYGLSEIIGPGVAQECEHRCGLHVQSDFFYPEVLDPVTRRPVPPGGKGELFITTLTKEAIPLLRYGTRDIVSLTTEPCRCGRTTPRISKVSGRTDDMIVVRGINVFPSQVEHVLLGIEGVMPHYQIIVDRKASFLDELEVLVEVEEKVFSDEIRELERLRNRIAKELEAVLSVGARVKLVEPRTLERSEGKAKRIIDRRNL